MISSKYTHAFIIYYLLIDRTIRILRVSSCFIRKTLFSFSSSIQYSICTLIQLQIFRCLLFGAESRKSDGII